MIKKKSFLKISFFVIFFEKITKKQLFGLCCYATLDLVLLESVIYEKERGN